MTIPTAIDIFPQPSPRWSFSVFKAPKFAQRKSKATSGRTLHVMDQEFPVWEWTLTYEILRGQDLRLASQWSYKEFDQIASFYTKMHGSYGPFLFFDPTDGRSIGQNIATANGSQVLFPLSRQLYYQDGGLFEPVHAAIANNDATMIAATGLASAPFNLYDNGNLVSTSDYTKVSHSNWNDAIYAVNFNSAPTTGHAITVDMTFFWPVRFSMDSQEFENFLVGRWGLRQLKFESYLIP